MPHPSSRKNARPPPLTPTFTLALTPSLSTTSTSGTPRPPNLSRASAIPATSLAAPAKPHSLALSRLEAALSMVWAATTPLTTSTPPTSSFLPGLASPFNLGNPKACSAAHTAKARSNPSCPGDSLAAADTLSHAPTMPRYTRSNRAPSTHSSRTSVPRTMSRTARCAACTHQHSRFNPRSARSCNLPLTSSRIRTSPASIRPSASICPSTPSHSPVSGMASPTALANPNRASATSPRTATLSTHGPRATSINASTGPMPVTDPPAPDADIMPPLQSAGVEGGSLVHHALLQALAPTATSHLSISAAQGTTVASQMSNTRNLTEWAALADCCGPCCTTLVQHDGLNCPIFASDKVGLHIGPPPAHAQHAPAEQRQTVAHSRD